MPWHPKKLQKNLAILMRRNVGYGQVLEGLEVRWGLVVKFMQALIAYPAAGALPWREGGQWAEPMHKYYDRKLFDVLSEEEFLARYAPAKHKGEFVDPQRAAELRAQGEEVEPVLECHTGEELHEAGFKVSVVRGAVDEAGEAQTSEVQLGRGDVVDEVSVEVFERWFASSGSLRLSEELSQWWLDLEPAGEAEASDLKVTEHDNWVLSLIHI